jgi:hypothetical protein
MSRRLQKVSLIWLIQDLHSCVYKKKNIRALLGFWLSAKIDYNYERLISLSNLKTAP